MGILHLLVSHIPFEVRRVSRFDEASLSDRKGRDSGCYRIDFGRFGCVKANLPKLTKFTLLHKQAEFYRNNVLRAYEKRVQPNIFICDFLDPGNLVLRVTDKDKVDYPIEAHFSIQIKVRLPREKIRKSVLIVEIS
ncbi:unnamed protein product [Brassica oleracea var. botrytis]